MHNQCISTETFINVSDFNFNNILHNYQTKHSIHCFIMRSFHDFHDVGPKLPNTHWQSELQYSHPPSMEIKQMVDQHSGRKTTQHVRNSLPLSPLFVTLVSSITHKQRCRNLFRCLSNQAKGFITLVICENIGFSTEFCRAAIK